jgi:hypothetical protein
MRDLGDAIDEAMAYVRPNGEVEYSPTSTSTRG